MQECERANLLQIQYSYRYAGYVRKLCQSTHSYMDLNLSSGTSFAVYSKPNPPVASPYCITHIRRYGATAAVHSVRQEMKVMEPHYSPGLIWVGKEAESGAQISVSSVRGDVVLWLDDPALNATAFVKDGVRRACSFIQAQQVGAWRHGWWCGAWDEV